MIIRDGAVAISVRFTNSVVMPAKAGIKRASSNHRRTIMGMERCYWVYILASAIGGTLYVGVTNNLVRRVYGHRMGLADGFTKKYRTHRLVYFEQYCEIETAILREKRLKKWNRAWKIRLIEESNPNWDDLYPQIAQP